jgi:hypothetical protein
MKEEVEMVEVLRFRQLLVALLEHRPDICVRHRLMGKMWETHFMRVIKLTEHGVLLNDETSNKFIHVSDLSQVIQFELDKPFQSYKPYYHYGVVVNFL